MHQLPRRWISALLLVLCSACWSTPDSGASAGLAGLEGHWLLTELEGEALEVPDGERGPTLEVSGRGVLSGFAGVNRLNGKLDREALAAGGFQIGSILTTRMAGSPEAMVLEQGYLRALEGAEAFELVGGELRLSGDGRVLASFQRAP